MKCVLQRVSFTRTIDINIQIQHVYSDLHKFPPTKSDLLVKYPIKQACLTVFYFFVHFTLLIAIFISIAKFRKAKFFLLLV